MKIGIENESLHLHSQNARLNIFELIEKVASMGAEGVQINVVTDYGLDPKWGVLKSNDPAHLKKVRALCDKLGLYIEMDARSLDYEYIAEVLKVSHALGSDTLRSYIPNKPPKDLELASGSDGKYDFAKIRQSFDTSIFKEAIPKLARILPLLKKYRIKLALENHEYETADEMVGVIEEFGSHWVGLLFDTGNSMMAWEDPLCAAKKMAKYTYMTHVKDHIIVEEPSDEYGYFVCGVPLGEGNIDIEAIYAELFENAPITRVNLEQCFPYATQFKRAPGTGGIYSVGKGAFAVRPHPYPYSALKPGEYYYPQEVSKQWLERLLKEQEEGLKRGLKYLQNIRDSFFNRA